MDIIISWKFIQIDNQLRARAKIVELIVTLVIRIKGLES